MLRKYTVTSWFMARSKDTPFELKTHQYCTGTYWHTHTHTQRPWQALTDLQPSTLGTVRHVRPCSTLGDITTLQETKLGVWGFRLYMKSELPKENHTEYPLAGLSYCLCTTLYIPESPHKKHVSDMYQPNNLKVRWSSRINKVAKLPPSASQALVATMLLR